MTSRSAITEKIKITFTEFKFWFLRFCAFQAYISIDVSTPKFSSKNMSLEGRFLDLLSLPLSTPQVTKAYEKKRYYILI